MLYQHIINGVPGAKNWQFSDTGTQGRSENSAENKRFLQFGVQSTRHGKISRTAVFCGFPVTAFPIERGVSYGPPLSLPLGGRKDSDHANDEFSNRSRSLNPAASPSGTTSTVGCRGSLAGIAAPRRKPSTAARPRSPRAPLFRTDRADLSRSCPVASRSWSWGAAANRPASPRTPTFSGGYSHD